MKHLLLLLILLHTIDMMLSRPTEPNRTRYIDPMAQTTTGALGQFEIQDTIINYNTLNYER